MSGSIVASIGGNFESIKCSVHIDGHLNAVPQAACTRIFVVAVQSIYVVQPLESIQSFLAVPRLDFWVLLRNVTF